MLAYEHLITRTRAELDLTDPRAVRDFFAEQRPEYVFLAAAKVGGIQANDRYPADFIRENLEIQTHVIDAAYCSGVTKLLFLGRHASIRVTPRSEDCLLTGPLEPTNQWYAVAKIAGITLCQAYRRQHGFNAISLMPTNLYGPGDNFHPEHAHVLPALIRRFHEAKETGKPSVTLWGTGTPRREFLHVDDLAAAAVLLMDRYDDERIINVGVGKDISIKELGELIASVVGYQGEIEFDPSRPDGTPRKLLDVSRLTALGWRPHIALREGIASTYDWYRNMKASPPPIEISSRREVSDTGEALHTSDEALCGRQALNHFLGGSPRRRALAALAGDLFCQKLTKAVTPARAAPSF